MKNFALIGAAGFIAPRHLKAISETGNNLLVALDKHDSVGILDSYFPKADFFTEFERFDRHVNKVQRSGTKIDYLTVCSPNYLHDSHVRFAIKNGIDVICEKPLVLNPWNLDALADLSKETGSRIYTILQLRHHPAIQALKKRVEEGPKGKIYDIDLTYITSRGRWYDFSWKGDASKSGGVATNIGIHFFDVLSWIFGDVNENVLHISEPNKAAGFLFLDRARVRWFLSTDANSLPVETKMAGQRTYRALEIEGEKVEFSQGFTDLHTVAYQAVLNGCGYGLEEAQRSIEVAYGIRNALPVGLKGDYHSCCKQVLLHA